MRRPPDLWLSEQVEWLAMILAVTLVLKFFVLEAYTIPTGSMQPAILGDADAGLHDRVLVDKLVPMLRSPRRWEVTIFRLPLDERELYVKRLVGLPGETLELRGGDVWIDGRIARKPPGVQDSMLRAIAWTPDGGLPLAPWFLAAGDVAVDGTSARVPAGGRGTLDLRRPVTARYDHGYDPAWGIEPPGHSENAVADLELSLTVTALPGPGGLTLAFRADDGVLALWLPAQGDPREASILYAPAQPADHPVRGSTDGPPALDTPRTLWLDRSGRALPADRPARVTAAWIDRRITLRVDDDIWLVHDQTDAGPRHEAPRRAGLSLALEGGGSLADVIVRRDVFYPPRTATTRWEIPEGHYFMLGDNAQASLDSRLFELRTVVLADREVTGFWLPAPPSGPAPPGANPLTRTDGRLAFADVHGDVTVFGTADVIAQHSAPAPFVHERYLLGKVLAVYWPVWPHFRWKLVR